MFEWYNERFRGLEYRLLERRLKPYLSVTTIIDLMSNIIYTKLHIVHFIGHYMRSKSKPTLPIPVQRALRKLENTDDKV